MPALAYSVSLKSIEAIFGGRKSFTPSSLFAASEPGGWYDPSDLTTLYQDAAGTTPVTAVEQPAGLVLDKSRGLVLGSELVTNGDFSTDTGWTKGAGWTISGGEAVATSVASGVPLSQPIASMAAGKFYRLTLTISSISAGGIRPYANNGGTYGTTVTTTGTYSWTLLAAGAVGGVYIATSGTTTATIDNISVRELPGSHLSQSTAAARPVLSARVNLLTYTETLTNSVWRKDFVTVTAGNLVYPSSGGSDRYVWYSLTGQATGVTYRTVLRVKNGGKNFAYIYNVRANSLFYVNLTTGVTSNVGTNIANLSTSVASDGWIDVSFDSVLTDAQTTAYVFVGPSDAAGSTAVTVNGTDGIYVNKVDLRPANAGVGLPAYQRVGAATDYDTTGFPLYLKFDGTDDFLQSATITPGSVDKAQVFAGVRKLSDAAAGYLVAFGLPFGGNSGSFAVGAAREVNIEYGAAARGSVLLNAQVDNSAYAAPYTNVYTTQIDIAGDSILGRSNGTQFFSGAGDLGTGNFDPYALSVGQYSAAAGLRFTGHLYSLILRFSATNMDAATITATETWVNQRTKAF